MRLRTFLVRDDERSRFSEVLVAAGVVAVPVRIEDELHRLGRDLRDRRGDLVAERRVLVVDHENRVHPGRDADVAAGAGQHVHGVGKLRRSHLDLGEIGLRRRRKGREGGQDGDARANRMGHVTPPFRFS
jgi:hypothetical protein